MKPRIRLLLLAALLVGACADEATDAAQTDGAASLDAADANADVTLDVGEPDPSFEVGEPCLTSDQCGASVCDTRKGGCVQCSVTAQCLDGMSCFNGECIEEAACSADAACESGVCGESGTCVECRADEDCAGSFECVDHVCRPPYGPCTTKAECASGVCVPSQQTCGDCLDDSTCGAGEKCEDYACVPKTCQPGLPLCEGDAIRLCRKDGTGSHLILCQTGQSCVSGVCVLKQCDPGTTECVKYQQKVCTDTGEIIIKNCPPGQECREGGCRNMRQRVLVVVDTSGSMNLFPGTSKYPKLCGGAATDQCLEPWPACEPHDVPITTMGVSKKVFSQFFSSDDSVDVIFALQRFPQAAKRSTPVCEGGYYEGDVIMTGDDGSHETIMGSETWFDESLDEVMLVPFPPPGSTSNLLPLLQWMDFKETLLKTANICGSPQDCEGGVCLGPAGNRRCHTFTNPELRAHGWTPLGKSLFYAGEYMRRYVVVDGKNCVEDVDCGSPGYFCGPEGKCFDPLKQCRLNVVVLFTDGGETEYPSTNDFFNPQVQAKRLRYGLGCTSDEQCSQLNFCRPKKAKPDETECFKPYCSEEGYCTNDAIANDPQKQKIAYKDTSEWDANRVRDGNGNPIDIIVNVVDASAADEARVDDVTNANRLVALYGGGVHVVVSVDDEADFLANLKKTIDFKSLFSQCAVSPGP